VEIEYRITFENWLQHLVIRIIHVFGCGCVVQRGGTSKEDELLARDLEVAASTAWLALFKQIGWQPIKK
jgi:hypothetical protein